jgi:glucose-6-phosphate isomerase, archaeal
MRGMFSDADALAALLIDGDPLIYEFHDMGVDEKDSEVAYGTSITYPGTVGAEYHMTKGHFHTILDTAEIYYCLNGQGLMMMENPEGDVQVEELTPGQAVYVPGRYAHRSINTHPDEPLVTFFAFPGHAGHDYGTIESRGFRKLVVDRDGTPQVIDNPQWASA